MGERTVLRVFRYDNPERLRGLAAEAATELGGVIEWNQAGDPHDSDLRLGHFDGVHTAYLPYISFTKPASKFFQLWRQLLKCPSLELRMQEGTLWDYTLFDGSEIADNFSTCPQYWEGEETPDWFIAERRGNPQLLSRLWGIPIERIGRYITQWGYKLDEEAEYEGVFHFLLTGKAYPTDEFEYGSVHQFYDFLRAIGGGFPDQQHKLVMPTEASQ